MVSIIYPWARNLASRNGCIGEPDQANFGGGIGSSRRMAALAAIIATIGLLLGPPRARAAEFQPATQGQIHALFDALTVTTPGAIEMLVFEEVRLPVKSDGELLEGAQNEQRAFKSAPTTGAGDAAEDLKNIVARRRSEQGKSRFNVERELWTTNAYRTDQTIVGDASITSDLEALLMQVETNASYFERTWVVDREKGPHYNFKINWRLLSSHYDTRRGSEVKASAHREAMLPNPALRIFATMLAKKREGRRWIVDPEKIQDCATGRTPHFNIQFRRSVFEDQPVDEFQINLKAKDSSVPTRHLAVGFQPDDYRRIVFSRTYDPVSGKLAQEAYKKDFDASGFPRVWDSSVMNARGQWVRKIRTYLKVNLNPIYDRDLVFGFNPPDAFAIENRSSGRTVIERYPMIGGKRLEPKNVVWDDLSARPNEGGALYRNLFLIIGFGLPLLFLIIIARKKHT